MKLKSIIFGMLALFGVLSASESDRVTGLSYFSFPGDYIGGGRKAIYLEGQGGKFSIQGNLSSHISVNFRGDSPGLWWHAEFSAPRGEELELGIYHDATRYPFQEDEAPGLTFGGSGRGHNSSIGTFEILELEHDEDGKVTAFAANFVQQGSSLSHDRFASPLFGSVRFNSSIPVEKGV